MERGKGLRFESNNWKYVPRSLELDERGNKVKNPMNTNIARPKQKRME
jgi:hypothetical protein